MNVRIVNVILSFKQCSNYYNYNCTPIETIDGIEFAKLNDCMEMKNIQLQ